MGKIKEIDQQKDVAPAHNNLHVEEMHIQSNFRWPLSKGTGESFVPHLTLHDGGQPIEGKHQGERKNAAHETAHAGDQDKSVAWTVHKGENLYGKAEHELRAHGKPDSHFSPEDIRKEVAQNAERNHWVKSADSAHSPEEQHRRAQFDAYVKDGKTSHLPKDLNGMVHKSYQDEAKPAIEPDGKALPKPTPDGKALPKPTPDGKVLPPEKKPPEKSGDKSEAAPPSPQKPHTVTDIDGKACKVQPTGEQIPALAGKAKGCEYLDPADPKHPENKELAEVVKRGKESTVGIDVQQADGHGGMGSGVIIGRSKDNSKIYVATDNHVASPEVNKGGKKAQSREVYTSDGKSHPAQLVLKDPGTDRAVLSVDVGAGNADKYKIAEFSDNSAEKGKGVVVGFPKDAHSIYASPANLNGEVGSTYMFGSAKGLPGENLNRPLIDMPGTHTEEGVSGAPIFNNRGEAVGLLEGGQKFNPMTGEKGFWSYGNPTTKAEVQNWLAQIQATEGKRR